MNESKRTSQVLKRFREMYPGAIAWKNNDRIARSRPDTVIFGDALVRVVEFKKYGNAVTPGQLLALQEFARAGFGSHVCVILPKGFDVFHVLANGELIHHDTYLTVDDLCRFLS